MAIRERIQAARHLIRHHRVISAIAAAIGIVGTLFGAWIGLGDVANQTTNRPLPTLKTIFQTVVAPAMVEILHLLPVWGWIQLLEALAILGVILWARAKMKSIGAAAAEAGAQRNAEENRLAGDINAIKQAMAEAEGRFLTSTEAAQRASMGVQLQFNAASRDLQAALFEINNRLDSTSALTERAASDGEARIAALSENLATTVAGLREHVAQASAESQRLYAEAVGRVDQLKTLTEGIQKQNEKSLAALRGEMPKQA